MVAEAVLSDREFFFHSDNILYFHLLMVCTPPINYFSNISAQQVMADSHSTVLGSHRVRGDSDVSYASENEDGESDGNDHSDLFNYDCGTSSSANPPKRIKIEEEATAPIIISDDDEEEDDDHEECNNNTSSNHYHQEEGELEWNSGDDDESN